MAHLLPSPRARHPQMETTKLNNPKGRTRKRSQQKRVIRNLYQEKRRKQQRKTRINPQPRKRGKM